MSELALYGGISANRIVAMILRYWYLLLSSWPRLLELLYWPALQVITWGFLQTYIAQNANFFARAGGMLIGAMSLIRLAIGVFPMTLLALFLFHFNFYSLGLPLIAFFCNLIFTSWAVGVV